MHLHTTGRPLTSADFTTDYHGHFVRKDLRNRRIRRTMSVWAAAGVITLMAAWRGVRISDLRRLLLDY